MESHTNFTKRFIGYTNQSIRKNLAGIPLDEMKFLLI